jgi:hypothetical protein
MPKSGLEVGVNSFDSLSDAHYPDALMHCDGKQRLVSSDDEFGIGCQSGADDHIIIGIGRDARNGVGRTTAARCA